MKKLNMTLNRKFNLFLVLAISFVMILYFSIDFYSSYKNNEEKLYSEAEYIADVASQSLEQPIWNFDIETISRIGNGMSMHEGIQSIRVYSEPDSEILFKTGDPTDGFYTIERDICYNRGQKIGRVELVFSYSQIHEILSEEFVAALIQMIAVLTVLIISINIIVKYMIDPLTELTEVAKKVGEGGLNTRASIHTGDEIETLALEFNQMADKLVQKIDEADYFGSHDPLTNLLNRTYLERNVKAWEEHAELPIGAVMIDINGLSLANDVYGHNFGDKLLVDMSRIILTNIKDGSAFRYGGDEFLALLPNCNEECLGKFVKHILTACEKSHYMDEGYTNLNVALGYDVIENFDRGLFREIIEVEEKMNRKKLLQEKSVHSDIISYLQNTLNERSKETFEHTKRLWKYSYMMAKHLAFKEDELNKLELFSTLHDLGKIAIPDAVLLKPGPLTDEEWEVMRTHSEVGYRLAMTSSELSGIAELILSHHERWDGNGYPRRLNGEEIPLLARILSIADAYDAMTEDRVYRRKLSKEVALAEIEKNAGTQFEAKLVKIFVEEMKRDSTC